MDVEWKPVAWVMLKPRSDPSTPKRPCRDVFSQPLVSEESTQSQELDRCAHCPSLPTFHGNKLQGVSEEQHVLPRSSGLHPTSGLLCEDLALLTEWPVLQGIELSSCLMAP